MEYIHPLMLFLQKADEKKCPDHYEISIVHRYGFVYKHTETTFIYTIATHVCLHFITINIEYTITQNLT